MQKLEYIQSSEFEGRRLFLSERAADINSIVYFEDVWEER